jgi:hypothetical protein
VRVREPGARLDASPIFENGIGRGGETPRDRKVEEPRRVGSHSWQADSAATQDSGAPVIARESARSRKRKRGWPGTETVSQGGGGEDPRGKPCGSWTRSNHGLDRLHPGIKALKRRAIVRWNVDAKPQEGMGRETGTDPGGDMLREGNLESAADTRIRQQGRPGRSRQVGRTQETEGSRGARPASDRTSLERCGERNLRRASVGNAPARRPTVQTRKASPRSRGMRTRSSDSGVRQDERGRPSEGLERGLEGSAERSRESEDGSATARAGNP